MADGHLTSAPNPATQYALTLWATRWTMKDLGQKYDRQLIYLRTNKDNWKDNLPTKNWLVLPICHDRDKELTREITETCLNNGVKYVCALGQECEFIHDYFDELIVMRRIEKGLSVEHKDDFEHEPMTTWHNDFHEGFWFAIHAAHDNYATSDKIVLR